MINDNISIEAVCESSILIRFSDQIHQALPQFINQVAELVYAYHPTSIMSITPSYTTLLIDYLPYRTSEKQMLKSLSDVILYVDQHETTSEQNLIELPVYYHEDVAPDLHDYLKAKSLHLDEFIQKHTGAEYTVCAIGFAPGFAFLSGLDDTLHSPRLSTPRLNVLAGSVGIGDNQTAVYPSSTPGGWNIVGNCPRQLFDPNTEKLSPFRVGDKVKFRAINQDEYIQLGGQLWVL